jgi:hypothetical protein
MKMKRSEIAARLSSMLPLVEFIAQNDPAYPPLINFSSHSDDARAFQVVVDAVRGEDTSFKATLGRQIVIEEVTLLLQRKQRDGEVVTERDVAALVQRLAALPIERWEVFRPVYGLTAVDGFPQTLGPFTVRTPQDARASITSHYPHCEPSRLDDVLGDAPAPASILGVAVMVRDVHQAREVADARFAQFVNVMHYMTWTLGSAVGVAVFDIVRPGPEKSLALSSTRASSQVRSVDITYSARMGNYYLTDPARGFDRIWDIVARWDAVRAQGGDLLERRVLAAVEWIGKGARDPDPARAFVQFMIALEVLYSIRGTDMPITQRLAEFSAFVAGRDRAERQKVAAEARDLYNKRSEIAHGSSQDASGDEARRAWLFVRRQIEMLLTDPELRTIQVYDDLRAWVDAKKYG